MPEEYADSSGNTQQFRAFVESPEPAPAKPPVAAYVLGGLAVLAALILVVWIAFG